MTGARADWPVASPDEAGFRADIAERLEYGLRSGLLADLHGLALLRDGRMVLERYFAGEDEAWGRPLGRVEFGPGVLHDLRSVTKSLVGLLYGIALDRGLVPPPEAPLFAQFPAYADLLAADAARGAITVGHVLTMTMDTEWREAGVPYTDPTNAEIAMENAPDRLRYVLERPVLGPPGRRWTYSGGAVALLGALIARGSGMTLPAFAEEALFGPLGIAGAEWAAGRDGVHSAASGARLRPRDLLRIGQMVLQGGVWDGVAVVPRGWIEASLRPAVATGEGLHYGYLWYLGEVGFPARPGQHRFVAAFGNGGQRLWLVPEAGVVLASVSGAYNRADNWVTPSRVFREIVMGNLVGGIRKEVFFF